MPLRPETEGLQTLEYQERCEWVQTCSHVAENLHSQLHNERQRSERLAEFKAMETFRWIRERRELPPCEIEFPWENYKPLSQIRRLRNRPELMITPAMVVP